MDAAAQGLEMLLRGAAAAALLFHLLHIPTTTVPLLRRLVITSLVASVLAYLVCSHPEFGVMAAWLRLLLLSLCLMSAPLVWLTVLALFDDDFQWSAWRGGAALVALVLGWVAFAGLGGTVVQVLHKLLLVAFGVAALWEVVRNWRSDLVSPRRALRSWAAGTMACYVLLVVILELLYLGRQAPPWLALSHLAGIGLVAGALALAMAKHPLAQWLGRAALTGVPPIDAPATAQRPPPAAVATPAPERIDRKAALRARLLQSMSENRAYAQESLTLAQLAGRLSASPAQLREVINQELGYRNFNDFLHHYRIDEAAQRLRRQDLPILSIALDVGYASIGPFNRAFKVIKGVTPSEYRLRGN